MNATEINLQVAELFARVFLGILLVAQGYDKLFVIKVKQVINTFVDDAQQKKVPYFFIAFSAYFTSVVEFFGGICLISGLFHEAVYVLLAINFILVNIGFSILKPMWDMQHVFPRVILLIIIIILSPLFYFGMDTVLFR
jgi:putative oxidoreductase